MIFGKLAPWDLHINAEGLHDPFQELPIVSLPVSAIAPGFQSALLQRQILVGYNQIWVDFQLHS